MKPLISKATDEFVKSLQSRVEEDVVNYFNEKDELDRIIYKGGLRIRNLYIDQAMNLMIIVLNNKKILKREISDFQDLKNASPEQLSNFTIDGVGIHWPTLDYDLSLKGFLEYELTFIDKPFSV
jgi:Protein of unknown function (DUF2442)